MDEDEETRGLRSRRPYERWRVKWGAVCVSVCERVFADKNKQIGVLISWLNIS